MVQQKANNGLEFTGERIVPGKVDAVLLEEHVARYKFALEYASDKNILDVACGTGYGCYILSKSARKVTGIDIDSNTVNFARKHYSSKNIEYFTGDALHLPFGDSFFNLVIGFEIFEHVKNPDVLISELLRVTANGGKIIISTPNAKYLKSSVKNPFHHKEYGFKEFEGILKKSINGTIEFFGQNRKTKPSSIFQIYLRFKKMLGIGPLIKKSELKIGSPDELLQIETQYEFTKENITKSEFFISIIEKK